MDLARGRGNEMVRWLGHEEGEGVKGFWCDGHSGGDGFGGIAKEGEVMLDDATGDMWGEGMMDEAREGYRLLDEEEEEGYNDKSTGMGDGCGAGTRGREGAVEEIDRLLQLGRL